MWIPFTSEECHYFIRCSTSYPLMVSLTDFKRVWKEEVLEEDLIVRFQEMNPLFDSDDLDSEKILKLVASLISGINSNTSTILREEYQEVALEFKRKLPECTITCKFRLIVGDEDMYFKEITAPLVHSVKFLEYRQKKLLDLLEKKDKEILQHQLEGGEISRKSLVTKTFDKNAFLEKAPDVLFLDVFGKSKMFQKRFIKSETNMKMENETNTNSTKRLKVEESTSEETN